MLRYNNKQVITRNVLLELAQEDKTNPSLEEAMKDWWINTRRSGGFRLTDKGNKAFEEARIEVWTISTWKSQPIGVPLRDEVMSAYKIASLTDKILEKPYYFTRKREVKVYDESEAVMISLYGSLEDYLESRMRMLNEKARK